MIIASFLVIAEWDNKEIKDDKWVKSFLLEMGKNVSMVIIKLLLCLFVRHAFDDIVYGSKQNFEMMSRRVAMNIVDDNFDYLN